MRASCGDFNERLIVVVKTVIPRNKITSVQGQPCARVYFTRLIVKLFFLCPFSVIKSTLT